MTYEICILMEHRTMWDIEWAFSLSRQQCSRLGCEEVVGTWRLVHCDQSSGWVMKIKSQSLAPYQTTIEELEKYLEDIRYVHLPREENQFADALSKLAPLINIPDHVESMPIYVERRPSLAYVNAIDDAEEVKTESWYTAILKFKETGEYPPDLDTRGKHALRMLSAQFIKTDDDQL
ncbi:uncharacterized protein LOC141630309 [Silene latifolia]|uniref:uncharacterized protein LOC141630309 n=1 Tax=Silene latifolia TaxID=37657 RepID=UPI003D77133C